MEAYLLDWANLLLRWAHVVVVIAWIGSSFYFVFLDNNLVPPEEPALKDKGVSGELWAVHGGGFYNPQKYMVAPGRVPANLHWFYWESYATWITGFALFTLLYLYQASTYLIDRTVFDWSPAAAIVTALGFLVAFWKIYDTACRVFGQRPGGERVVACIAVAAIVLAAWGACQLFSGRAAFLLVGAMLATAMTANVAHWIIPGQRKVIAQMKAGEPVDPIHGLRGKQRSVHNTYFTLPVLFAMLSNHYGFLYRGPNNWVVLLALMAAGALIRHSFVARHKARQQGRRVPWEFAGLGMVLLAAVGVALAPAASGVSRPSVASAASGPSAAAQRFVAVQGIVTQRCVMCHNAQLMNKNVQLHTPELLAGQAQAVYQQTVVQKLMPFNNATGMTDAERTLIKQWFEAGATTK